MAKPTKADIEWVVSLVELHQGYGGLLHTWLVGGGLFDAFNCVMFGAPNFDPERLHRVTMVRSWLSVAKRKGLLKVGACCVPGKYPGGDVPLGYYTPSADVAQIVSDYDARRVEYFSVQDRDKNRREADAVPMSLRDLDRSGVMALVKD